MCLAGSPDAANLCPGLDECGQWFGRRFDRGGVQHAVGQGAGVIDQRQPDVPRTEINGQRIAHDVRSIAGMHRVARKRVRPQRISKPLTPSAKRKF